ncbi:MAG TPA: DUF3145 domain-containing protein [Dermatophilaceae bacterium]|nr:DUF3145 domain-containing protein [Dermatophilaceae bacterium]
MSGFQTCATTRGAVFVHSAPAALCPHITWALDSVLGPTVRLDWTAQTNQPAQLRADASWIGDVGTGAQLASALRACGPIRYEVVEEPSPGADGSRWSYTPRLGIHHSVVCSNGDVVVNENQVKAALAEADLAQMRGALERALGSAWDSELEPFRTAGEGNSVRWLHRVG